MNFKVHCIEDSDIVLFVHMDSKLTIYDLYVYFQMIVILAYVEMFLYTI